jgi:hypothetical protein
MVARVASVEGLVEALVVQADMAAAIRTLLDAALPPRVAARASGAVRCLSYVECPSE